MMGVLNKLDGWVRDCLGFLVAWIWIALIATAMTVTIATIAFPQTSGTANESEPAAGNNARPVQDRSGTEDDTSVETDPPARSATPGAVEEEIQSRFNELGRELLDNRADYIDRWLSVTAIVLTFFGIVVAIAGFLGFRRFREIETEARTSVEAAKQHEAAAKDIRERIEGLLSESEERVQLIRNLNAEAAAQKPTEAKQAVKDARKNPKASLTDKVIANALDLQQQGRNKEAIEKWRAIAHVAEEIDNELAAQAEFSVGYLLGDEDPEGSISAYDKSIRLKPNNFLGYNNRGGAKNARGEHEAAIADYDQAIRLKPDYANAFINRGNAKGALGQHEDAIADYDEAIRLKPDLAGAYNNRGNAKQALGRHKDAIADYDKAVGLKPDYAEAYSNRGNTKQALEQHKDAIADYNEAIRLKPDYANAYRNRGEVKAALGLKEEARKDFETALEMARNANNADMVAQLEQLLRDLNYAEGS